MVCLSARAIQALGIEDRARLDTSSCTVIHYGAPASFSRNFYPKVKKTPAEKKERTSAKGAKARAKPKAKSKAKIEKPASPPAKKGR